MNRSDVTSDAALDAAAADSDLGNCTFRNEETGEETTCRTTKAKCAGIPGGIFVAGGNAEPCPF